MSKKNPNFCLNEFGMVFNPMGPYNEFHVFPPANAKTSGDIANHKFPDLLAKSRWIEAVKTILKNRKTHIIIAPTHNIRDDTSVNPHCSYKSITI